MGTVLSRGYLGIIRFFGWKKVAIITQNENVYSVVRRNRRRDERDYWGERIFSSALSSQMMNYLKRDLTQHDVGYTEKVFTTADGVGGLGPEPFVS